MVGETVRYREFVQEVTSYAFQKSSHPYVVLCWRRNGFNFLTLSFALCVVLVSCSMCSRQQLRSSSKGGRSQIRMSFW